MSLTIPQSRGWIIPRHYHESHEVDPRLGLRNTDTFNHIVHNMYADFNEEQGTTEEEEEEEEDDVKRGKRFRVEGF